MFGLFAGCSRENAAKVLPPKAFAGSSVKSSVAALEAFVAERLTVTVEKQK